MRVDRRGGELAAGGDVVAHEAPQPVEEVAGGLAVLVGHVAAGEGLGEGLVFADAEHVHLDAELVERVLEVGAVARQAAQQHEAVGRQVELVGHRGEVVLRLGEALAARQHRLARGLEVGDRGAQLGELGEAAADELVGLDHQRGDARVVARRAHRLDQVGEAHLSRRRPPGAQQRQRRLELGLLDDRAHRPQHQRGPRRHLGLGVEEEGHQHAEAEDQQGVEDAAHDEVERAHEHAQHIQ